MISIVIPIYNSRDILEHTIADLSDYFENHSFKYEILLRDDGSTDNSRTVMEEVAQKYNNVRLFFNPKNKGLGATLNALFKDAKGDCIIYFDCDLPFGCDVIEALYERVPAFDVIVASRYKGKKNNVSLIRKFFSRLYYHFCGFLFNTPIVDIGSGTVLFKKSILEKITITSKGFSVHIELFVRSWKRGAKIIEIAAESKKQRKSSFSILRHGPAIFIETLGFYNKFKRL